MTEAQTFFNPHVSGANGHEIVKCSCGRVIMQCRCFMPNKPVRIVQDGCEKCKNEKPILGERHPIYETMRGKWVTERPYGNLTMEERKEIIRDALTIGRKETCKKWNVNRKTIGHLFYEYKHTLLIEVEDEQFAKAGL